MAVDAAHNSFLQGANYDEIQAEFAFRDKNVAIAQQQLQQILDQQAIIRANSKLSTTEQNKQIAVLDAEKTKRQNILNDVYNGKRFWNGKNFDTIRTNVMVSSSMPGQANVDPNSMGKLAGIGYSDLQAKRSEYESHGATPNAPAAPAGATTAKKTGTTGTGGGTKGTGGGGVGAAPGTTAGSDADILAKYPNYAWAMGIDDLKGVLRKAVQAAESGSPMTPDQIQGAIEGTNWWKTNSGTTRQYYQEEHQDPAKWNQDLQTTAEKVKQRAGQLGIAISKGTAETWARSMLYSGWGDAELDKAMADQFTYTGAETGNIGVLENNIKKLAAQYMVPMADSTMQAYAQTAIKNNDFAAEQFTNQIKEQAKGLFPTLAPYIDKGVTVAQYVDPYKQLAAKDLEVSSDSIDFSNTKWSKALQTSDGNGTLRPMTLSEFQAMYKTDKSYGYDKTQGAKQQASDLVSQLGQMMGVG